MATKLLAPLRSWEARRALRAARERADVELAASRLPSPRLAWRIAELVDDEHRVDLARRLTDIVHTADERLLPGASPVDRVAVRATRSQLLEVAARVCDTERSVTPRGVVLLERLLDGGALFGRDRVTRLRSELATVREALEPAA
jgi:hypothetical protein